MKNALLSIGMIFAFLFGATASQVDTRQSVWSSGKCKMHTLSLFRLRKEPPGKYMVARAHQSPRPNQSDQSTGNGELAIHQQLSADK